VVKGGAIGLYILSGFDSIGLNPLGQGEHENEEMFSCCKCIRVAWPELPGSRFREFCFDDGPGSSEHRVI
jgi:hypothetical protein